MCVRVGAFAVMYCMQSGDEIARGQVLQGGDGGMYVGPVKFVYGEHRVEECEMPKRARHE